MLRRFRNRLKFILERWLQGGIVNQLLLMVALIALIAVSGGLVGWAFGAFRDPAVAIWWAFLRLTDPGYLGDDEGAFLRTLSTLITVLGYVLFMGSLIAIMTQWLRETMQRLESGLTPIAMRDHLLILGWTNRTAAIVRELLLSEGRVRRFLRRHGTRRLRIVILADDVTAALRLELRERVGPVLGDHDVFLRSGSSLRVDHLDRVDYERAAAVLLPGADFAVGGAANTDARVIKSLLSMANRPDSDGPDQRPHVVAEVFDPDKAPIAQQAYPALIDVLASDGFISRLIAQNVRHGGLSHVYTPLLSYSHPNEVYVRTATDALIGRNVRDLGPLYARAVLLGVVRPSGSGFEPMLNPAPEATVQRDDRLVFIARDYDDTVAEEPSSQGEPPTERVERRRATSTMPQRRVLLLGWSHKVAPLLEEFGSYLEESFEVDLLSRVPLARREAALARLHPSGGVKVRHLEGDYTIHEELQRLDLGSYDNIVFLGSSRLETSEETDARTILGYVVVRELLDGVERRPKLLVELVDPANAQLFGVQEGEVIISPVVLSHMLAHVTLRRELLAVFEELFGPGGAEIVFRPASHYGLAGHRVRFGTVRRRVAHYGQTALGVRMRAEAGSADGGVHLNPKASAEWRLGEDDEVVVLTTLGRAER